MNDQRTAYPGRAPKKYPKPDLHGRVRWCDIPYKDVNRAIKFFTDVFDWNFNDAPNAYPNGDPGKRFIWGTTGPSQPGTEAAVPGFVNVALIHPETHNYLGNFFADINVDLSDTDVRVGGIMEVHMDEPISKTLEKVKEWGGEVVWVDPQSLKDELESANWLMSAIIKDPSGNQWNIWRCPASRTWEEPEAGYDKE